MCGRFTQLNLPGILAKAPKKLKAKMVFDPAFFQPRYNIAPSSEVQVIRIPYQETERVFEALKWGLVPVWAQDPKIGNSLANARAETVAEKPSFRSAFKKQRCLVPVDGFFEWNQETDPKQPHYFFMKDKEPFFLAGLWEYWKPKTGDGKPITSFTLITTEANAVLSPVHDRMPVIIDPKNFDEWLDPMNQDVEKLKKLLKPFPASKMASYPVSTFMSNARNQGPECIAPIKVNPHKQLDL